MASGSLELAPGGKTGFTLPGLNVCEAPGRLLGCPVLGRLAPGRTGVGPNVWVAEGAIALLFGVTFEVAGPFKIVGGPYGTTVAPGMLGIGMALVTALDGGHTPLTQFATGWPEGLKLDTLLNGAFVVPQGTLGVE